MSGGFFVTFPPVDATVYSFLPHSSAPSSVSSAAGRAAHDDAATVFLILAARLFLPETADDDEEEEEEGHQTPADGGVEDGGLVEPAFRRGIDDDPTRGRRPVSRAARQSARNALVASVAREIARGAVRKRAARRFIAFARRLAKAGQGVTVEAGGNHAHASIVITYLLGTDFVGIL